MSTVKKLLVACAPLCALLLGACESSSSAPRDVAEHTDGATDAAGDTAPARTLRVMTVNIGNLDEVSGGPCPAYYKGAQCELDLERAIATNLAKHQPDIIVLNEVWDSSYCKDQQPDADANHVCHDFASRTPLQQARRLLGSGYTIVCDAIAHFDCVAVLAARIAVDECAAGDLCIDGAKTPPHPQECAGRAGISSVSSIHVKLAAATAREGSGDLAITVVNGHPLNAYTDETDRCRLAQYRQIFENLADGARNLIMGDMNGDPIRGPSAFPSHVYWNQQVGEGLRYRYHSGIAEHVPPLPTFLGALTLDHVVSDFARGSCVTLGYGKAVDSPFARMDHRALLCELTVP